MLDDDFFELDEHFLSTIDVDNLVEAGKKKRIKFRRNPFLVVVVEFARSVG